MSTTPTDPNPDTDTDDATPEPSADTVTYLLRGVPAEEWARFRVQCEADHVPMRTALIHLLTAYGDGAVVLSARHAPRKTSDR